MKTEQPQASAHSELTAAPIIQLVDEQLHSHTDWQAEAAQLTRARAFAEPLLQGQLLASGEDAWEHANAVSTILQNIGAAPSMQAAVYLVYAGDYLNKPEEVVTKAFGPSYASLVTNTRKLVQLQRAAREAQLGPAQRAQQTERVRKMLLAFSRDLRVVLLRLASRLQTLRFYAAHKLPCAPAVASESLHVFAPLANRLGLWQLKWELEDWAFRFLEPEHYQQVAKLLAERRVEREQRVETFRQELAQDLLSCGLNVQVQGRPKHLYSIWKKMQGKRLAFSQVLDVRAVRVITLDVPTCYAVLGRIHELFGAVTGELDDYIERPKPNGYQSLHTVIQDQAGRPVEVQIRTQAMHDHAEHGVAAHWAYKDAGTKGYAGVVQADAAQQAHIAEARKAVLRQLLAWERDTAKAGAQAGAGNESTEARPTDDDTALSTAAADQRIYVFTPDATVIDLPAGATPIDFAYAVHTTLGHRCRGAKLDGSMVSLNTALRSGQTVEVVTAKEGGPSLDWLNPELQYVKSARSKAKVRAWFNAVAQNETIARGRESVEKLLQRLGKTAIKLDDLAARLGFRSADALFEMVGKDEFSRHQIEALLRPAEPAPTPDEVIALRHGAAGAGSNTQSPASNQGGVLVVGMASLMTQLARCCRPAPPDAISGYVTRDKGVAVHRTACRNFQHMARTSAERVIPVAWSQTDSSNQNSRKPTLYPVDVLIEATDRPGLLRDISELFSKEKMNVTGLKTQTAQDTTGHVSRMTFTVEVFSTSRLKSVLSLAEHIDSVRSVRRR
jgi:GTP pyrophosphokinase